MQAKMSLKKIQEMLPKGKKVFLIHNVQGPCYKPRTISSVNRTEIRLLNENDQDTYNPLGTHISVNRTEKGFTVSYKDKVQTEYIFGE